MESPLMKQSGLTTFTMISQELRDGSHNKWLRRTSCNWKMLCLLLCILIIIMLIAILVPIFSKSSLTMKCSGEWIGVREKCFYFSDDTRDWTASKNFCSSQGSELAQIDTKEDMEFLKKHIGTFMHWIGLSRKQGESWKWTNGTVFNGWFEINGNGFFAFLSADGVYSSRGFVDIKWICSKPRF
ncbi:C-type lectin domain family 2 member A isoform X1 [Rousettus aegyptiacus]|uniref:C-type lectin domain family 2 member A isoform X1 n=1 Tax=Rousettus aegyptiacus TaxID=9407 RepID=UPI00168D293F|nr:C-type lectin domain family 2 member A isoform X1 [Rousettus aegyptiacus]